MASCLTLIHTIILAIIQTQKKCLKAHPESNHVKVIFLGTAASLPTSERAPPCIAIAHDGEFTLFDCGEGCQRQMRNRVSYLKIKRIFISHFHGDHYLGLLGLMQTMTLHKRSEALEIYTPRGGKKFLENYFASGYVGLSYEVRVREMGEEIVEFSEYAVESFSVEHKVPCLGFVFRQKDRRGKFDRGKANALGIFDRMFGELERLGSLVVGERRVQLKDVTGAPRRGKKIVYSSDTLPTPALVEKAKRADLFICDSTFVSDDDRNDTLHCTVREACAMAEEAHVERLVLTHISQRYSTEEVLEEARKYRESVSVAEDFMEIEL